MITVIYERSGNYWSVKDEEGEFGFIDNRKEKGGYVFKLTEEKFLNQSELEEIVKKLAELNQ